MVTPTSLGDASAASVAMASSLPQEDHLHRAYTTASAPAFSESGRQGNGPVPGPKAVLRELVAEGPPMTAGELWIQAEKRGLKSKRFMKEMLKQMRQRGEVVTSPPPSKEHHGQQSFLYRSSSNE
jgi:hypothetical protein